MEVYEAIKTRRSIRKYSTIQIPRESIEKIIEAGMYAPSAVNKQPWHFIVFNNKELIKSIIEIHANATMLAHAHTAILVCYDKLLQHDEGYGVIDCSAATQNMLLAAHELGIGSCWVGIAPRQNRMEALHDIFHLPATIVPFSIVSMGFPIESKETPARFQPQRIHWGKW